MVLAGTRSPPGPDDLQAQPALPGGGVGADLAAEGNGGAAVIVGVDGLDQGGGPGGPGDGGGQHRGRALGGRDVVRLSARRARLVRAGAGPRVQVPAVQAVGEVQVARLVARASAGQRGQRPARRRVAGPGPGGRRDPVEERGEQVIARHRDGQPVQRRVGEPDRGARGGGERQAQPEVRGDLPRSGRAGQPDPRHGDLRAQAGGTGFGQVDVHPGHPGPGGAEQPGGEFLRDVVGDGLVGGPFQEGRQVAGSGHPDGHGPVARVVGQHDQVAAGVEFAVGQPPGPGFGMRDSESRHTLKCRPRGPVLPASRSRRLRW